MQAYSFQNKYLLNQFKLAGKAARAMYEGAGYRILDGTDPVHAQFTASLNLHDGATHGRRHYLMAKDTTTTEWC